jgi:hypothetical protein
VLHLGLGGAARAEGVRVLWPDGSEQDLGPLDAGGRYRAEQGKPGVARVEGT